MQTNIKTIWKKYHRHTRMAQRAKWYLDNIQRNSITMNQKYAYHKYQAEKIKSGDLSLYVSK